MLERYLQNSIQEILASRSLKYFGSALALTHVFSFWFWTNNGNLLLKYLRDPFRVCWPIYSQCYKYTFASDLMVHAILGIYGVLALTCFLAFLIKAFNSYAYPLLLFLFFFKLFIFFQDYRFMGNYHYMPLWVSIAYLFFPDKIRTTFFLIPLFYFFAGILKFNVEWLSSVSFTKPIALSAKLLEWLCAYVPFLEMLMVWGLLSKKRLIFWFTFMQLFCFHFFSYFIVGIFYPAIMACLLTVYIFVRNFELNFNEIKMNILSLNKPSMVFLAAFVILQLPPFFYSGDSALTGEGRMFSLNMLDANVQCDDFIFLKYQNGQIREAPRKSLNQLGVRINCDPLVIFAEASTYCRSEKNRPDFIDLDLGLTAKRTSDASFQKIIEIRDFCKSKSWIDVAGGIHKPAH